MVYQWRGGNIYTRELLHIKHAVCSKILLLFPNLGCDKSSKQNKSTGSISPWSRSELTITARQFPFWKDMLFFIDICCECECENGQMDNIEMISPKIPSCVIITKETSILTLSMPKIKKTGWDPRKRLLNIFNIFHCIGSCLLVLCHTSTWNLIYFQSWGRSARKTMKPVLARLVKGRKGLAVFPTCSLKELTLTLQKAHS